VTSRIVGGSCRARSGLLADQTAGDAPSPVQARDEGTGSTGQAAVGAPTALDYPRGMADACNHGVTFDHVEAQKLFDGWTPRHGMDVVLGNPAWAEVRVRWPRLSGTCPLGCGFNGIAYASAEHHEAGYW